MSSIPINLKDSYGQHVLVLDNFRYSPSEVIDQFKVDVIIHHNGFVARTEVNLERHDLKGLMNGIQQLLHQAGKYATLNPEGDRFRLLCEQVTTGHINVQIHVRDTLHTTKLDLSFGTERFFLADMLRDLSNILDKYASTS